MSYYAGMGEELQRRHEAKITFVESTLQSIRDDTHVIRTKLHKLSIEDLDKVWRQLRTLRHDILDVAEEIAKETG